MTTNQFRREVWRRGGRRAVAEALGIHPETLTRWSSRRNAADCLAVERLPVVREATKRDRQRLAAAMAGARGRWRVPPARREKINLLKAELETLKNKL